MALKRLSRIYRIYVSHDQDELPGSLYLCSLCPSNTPTGHLDLSDNELSGTLTSEFHHMTSLVELTLRNNIFEGDIDEILMGLDQLGIIDMRQNNFHGRLGSAFLSLSRLGRSSLLFDET